MLILHDFESAPPQNIQSITPFVKKLASSFSGTGYKRVIIFVDNYGMSLVLGIVPLCNYLLLGNVSIVLAASSSPSLGDITVLCSFQAHNAYNLPPNSYP